jgi:hypothetical protein
MWVRIPLKAPKDRSNRGVGRPQHRSGTGYRLASKAGPGGFESTHGLPNEGEATKPALRLLSLQRPLVMLIGKATQLQIERL